MDIYTYKCKYIEIELMHSNVIYIYLDSVKVVQCNIYTSMKSGVFCFPTKLSITLETQSAHHLVVSVTSETIKRI